jgi:hypothetical protein
VQFRADFLVADLEISVRFFFINRTEKPTRWESAMKKFAAELADFLRRHYPDAMQDGWYRFSADINIVGGEVDVEIPMLTRLPDLMSLPSGKGKVTTFKPRDSATDWEPPDAA